MYVPVVLIGDNEELVSKDELQFLLVNHQVSSIKRSDGWAVIGRDKMRNHKTPTTDKDRREHDVYAFG